MTFFSDHAQDSATRRWYLLEIGFDTPERYTNCEVPIVTTSPAATWEARPFVIGRVQIGPDGPSCTVVIGDGDQRLFPLLSDTNGAQGLVVQIWEAAFADDNATGIPTEIRNVYAGRIDRTRVDTAGLQDQVEFQCGPPVVADAVEIPPRTLEYLMRYKNKLSGWTARFVLTGRPANLIHGE